MNDSFEAYGVAVIVVFGALAIGGLIAASVGFGSRDSFFFALGAAAAAWVAGYAIFLDRPKLYIGCLGVAVLMSVAATLTLAF